MTTTSTTIPSSEPAAGRSIAAILIVLWFAIVLLLGRLGVFVSDGPPLAILTAVLAPPLLFGLAYRALPAVRAFALGLDLRLLTGLQAWRVLGGGFLMLYAFGLLPALFAWTAGLGDLLVGIAAPFVALSLARRAEGWQWQVRWLNLAGLADFVLALGTGVLTSQGIGLLPGEPAQTIMARLPLGLIPTFAVPLWTILHLISLLQLRHQGGR